jgi:uncharacterized YccA/Bax inhibitor family protein
MLRTANPALREKVFKRVEAAADARQMTIQGTMNKTLLLLFLLLISSVYTWRLFFARGAEAVYPWLIGGAIGGLIVALVTIFKKTWSPITAPLYAVLEGLFLGGLSSIMEFQFPGIVLQAVGLTFGVLLALLFLYKSRIINVTAKFRTGVIAATGAIFLVYLVTLVLRLFGVGYISFIHGSGTVGILFSLFVVVIASLNLVLDFDFIEKGSQQGLPGYMEWYASFGLMVTLIWLYIEILRLLAKLQSRD